MGFRKEIIEREGKPPIINLYGELDIYATQDFKNDSIELLKSSQDDLYLDFTNLDYIDSTGLGALISILKESQEIGKNIYLIEVNERIRKLFKITQLEDMFKFIGEIDE
ncbi:MAG: STAS domain-containing protein [Neofamilia sp.]